MLSVAERIAQVAEHLIKHNAHGYSQPNRGGDGTEEAIALSDGSTVVVHGADYDCSELIRVSVNCALSGRYNAPIATLWTGNERSILKDLGFVQVSLTQVKRGDILWRSGHTEVYLGDGICGGARIDESGTIYGNAQGDQTGAEITSGIYTAGNWQSAWRFYGDEDVTLHWYVEETASTGETMDCIISIKGRNTLVWFDGVNVNDLTSTKDVDVLDVIARACYGTSLPRVTLTEEQFARLCQSIRGGYPKHLRALVEKYAPRSPEE